MTSQFDGDISASLDVDEDLIGIDRVNHAGEHHITLPEMLQYLRERKNTGESCDETMDGYNSQHKEG